MKSQNILNFYSSAIDIELDTSETHDYEVAPLIGDFDSDALNFTIPITYDSIVFGTNPCYTNTTYLPLENIVATEITGGTCVYTIDQRTSLGWTLDFIFNKSGNTWSDGSVFYYIGLKDETNEWNYGDNNLSFSFNDNGEIVWNSYRYTGYCDNGYKEEFYVSSGVTAPLCDSGTTNDFNITITFERYNEYSDCSIYNEGGINDLMSGQTFNISGLTYHEVLNYKWNEERNSRLGDLKIYFNGRLHHKFENWEEIIPSQRMSTNPIVQIWASGTTGSGDLHLGACGFDIKEINYYSEPLTFPQIFHDFIYRSDQFTFTTCNECSDTLTPL
jgi:hypothetical protein